MTSHVEPVEKTQLGWFAAADLLRARLLWLVAFAHAEKLRRTLENACMGVLDEELELIRRWDLGFLKSSSIGIEAQVVVSALEYARERSRFMFDEIGDQSP